MEFEWDKKRQQLICLSMEFHLMRLRQFSMTLSLLISMILTIPMMSIAILLLGSRKPGDY
jgi:hypothetical protein